MHQLTRIDVLSLHNVGSTEIESNSFHLFRKVPSSPRCPSVSSVSMVPTAHSQLVASASIAPCSSPKPVGTPGLPRGRQPSLTSQMAARALNTSQYSEPCTSLSPLCHDQPSMPVQVKTYVPLFEPKVIIE